MATVTGQRSVISPILSASQAARIGSVVIHCRPGVIMSSWTSMPNHKVGARKGPHYQRLKMHPYQAILQWIKEQYPGYDEEVNGPTDYDLKLDAKGYFRVLLDRQENGFIIGISTDRGVEYQQIIIDDEIVHCPPSSNFCDTTEYSVAVEYTDIFLFDKIKRFIDKNIEIMNNNPDLKSSEAFDATKSAQIHEYDHLLLEPLQDFHKNETC